MNSVLLIFESVLSALLVLVILVQTRGTGFGRTWTASSTSFSRRGLEKLVFRATFVLSALFILISIIALIV